MTNNEAVKMIKDDIRLHHDSLSGAYRQALNMAVEALKFRDAYKIVVKAANKAFENKQSVWMEWIPVTERERLPKDGERVLATHLGGANPERQVIEHVYINGKFTCGWDMDMDINSPTFGQRYMGDVVAWMPLPEPYRGKQS